MSHLYTKPVELEYHPNVVNCFEFYFVKQNFINFIEGNNYFNVITLQNFFYYLKSHTENHFISSRMDLSLIVIFMLLDSFMEKK